LGPPIAKRAARADQFEGLKSLLHAVGDIPDRPNEPREKSILAFLF
jgi:hypothetical protein